MSFLFSAVQHEKQRPGATPDPLSFYAVNSRSISSLCRSNRPLPFAVDPALLLLK